MATDVLGQDDIGRQDPDDIDGLVGLKPENAYARGHLWVWRDEEHGDDCSQTVHFQSGTEQTLKTADAGE